MPGKSLEERIAAKENGINAMQGELDALKRQKHARDARERRARKRREKEYRAEQAETLLAWCMATEHPSHVGATWYDYLREMMGEAVPEDPEPCYAQADEMAHLSHECVDDGPSSEASVSAQEDVVAVAMPEGESRGGNAPFGPGIHASESSGLDSRSESFQGGGTDG